MNDRDNNIDINNNKKSNNTYSFKYWAHNFIAKAYLSNNQTTLQWEQKYTCMLINNVLIHQDFTNNVYLLLRNKVQLNENIKCGSRGKGVSSPMPDLAISPLYLWTSQGCKILV